MAGVPMFFERLPEFFSNHIILVAVLVVIVVMLVSGEIAHLTRKYRSLSPQALTHLINRESPLLIDMSSLKDFDAGHIVGARHVPLSQFDPENKDLVRVRELPVAIYCGNGQTSSNACARLSKAGFTSVHWLDGGLAAWRSADLPVTRDKPQGKSPGKALGKSRVKS